MLVAGPWRLELGESIVGPGGAWGESILGVKRVERAARQRLHAWQGRQAAVFAHVGPRHAGGGGFQRAGHHQYEPIESMIVYSRERAASLSVISHGSHLFVHRGRSSGSVIQDMCRSEGRSSQAARIYIRKRTGHWCPSNDVIELKVRADGVRGRCNNGDVYAQYTSVGEQRGRGCIDKESEEGI